MVDGIILFKDHILVLKSKITTTIINKFHGSTHEGYVKNHQGIKVNFYWPMMRKQIKEFIQDCDVCQYHKREHLALASLLQPLPIPSQIWDQISLDFIEGLLHSHGKTTIFVLVNRMSTYAFIRWFS